MRVGCPGVDDDAVSLAAFLVAQRRAPFDPLLRQVLMGQRPTEEPMDPSMLIDDEEIMSAIDLADEHLRPFAELELGEDRLFYQELDCQAQGSRPAFGFPCAQD